ncbi:MAG: RNA 2',3'-cyclic phosphodiesterase [Acidobacteriota bacterium]|nr:RNA 2',3'-cyclic phosphodiesterase [Acidobacteriota bacterium]
MRAFIAVDISEESRRLVAERIAFLRARFSDLRAGWEKPEKLHLTLKFLGEVPEEKLPAIISAVEDAAKNIDPFPIVLEGAGAFPSRGAARVLWLGVKDESQYLKELQKLVETETERIGFEKERRAFKPHLTIARLKEPEKARSLTDLHLKTEFPAINFSVSEVVVYKSDLRPTGSIYTPLARIVLNQEKARR